MSKSFIWFLPAVCVFFGILLLSTAFSVPIKLEGVSYLDKWEHAFAYFVLINTLLFGFSKSGLLSNKLWLVLLISCSSYGVVLEWVQYSFFPNRVFEWLDACANVVGTLLGALLFRLFKNGKK